MRERHPPPPCGIDDDTIELYVMDKLRDKAALEHLEACGLCAVRVSKHVALVASLRRALREHQETDSRSLDPQISGGPPGPEEP